MNKDYKDTWIYIESEDEIGRETGYELITPGKKLAEAYGESLVVVVIGAAAAEVAQTAISYGADRVITVEGNEYESFSVDAYTHALAELVKKYRPATLVTAATDNGRELAPRLSCRLRTGLVADCIDIQIDQETNEILWISPAFGGKLIAAVVCPEHRPQMSTVRPGVFKKSEKREGVEGSIIAEDIRFPFEEIRTRNICVTKESNAGIADISDSEILVAGGRGMGSAENFTLIAQLAETLSGAIAASRIPVDLGWVPHQCMVGQTGKTVRPKLYIACGISGALQHIAGMSASDVIVAINKDENASIFDIADYGVVGDATKIIPALIKEIKKRVNRGG